jgi:hypothetical protein
VPESGGVDTIPLGELPATFAKSGVCRAWTTTKSKGSPRVSPKVPVMIAVIALLEGRTLAENVDPNFR